MSTLPPFLRGLGSRQKEYKSGERVEFSGIYDVVHDASHHEAHQVTSVKGEHFPPCKCGRTARFTLHYEAEHLSHHPLMKH
jgi:hypothetical protein